MASDENCRPLQYNGFVKLKAQKSDFQDIYNFMLKDFLINEPLNEALGVDEEEVKEFFADIVHSSLKDNVSYICRQKTSSHCDKNDEFGKIIAICLSFIITRPNNLVNDNNTCENLDSNEHRASVFSSPKTLHSPKIQKIENFLNALESKIWTILSDQKNRLLSLLILSVDSDFTKQGIAKKLIDHNFEENARRLNCQGIYTEATAFVSQQLFAKCGYSRIYEILHSEWLDEETKEQIFKCKNCTDRGTLEYKDL